LAWKDPCRGQWNPTKLIKETPKPPFKSTRIDSNNQVQAADKKISSNGLFVPEILPFTAKGGQEVFQAP
jgi:hypothetical protein